MPSHGPQWTVIYRIDHNRGKIYNNGKSQLSGGQPLKIHDVVYIYHLEDPRLVSWHSRTHAHGDNLFEFHYFISGEGEFKNGNTTRSIQPGTIHLTYPHQVHGIKPGRPSRPLTYYAVLFEFHQARDAPMADINHPRITAGFPLALGPMDRLKFADIKNRYNAANQFHRMSAELELTSFLFGLMGTLQDSSPTTHQASTAPRPPQEALPDTRPGHPSSADVYVAQAMDIFQDHVTRNLRLADVAATLRISEEYLIRVFRAKLGVSPAKWFQSLKVETSGSLLLNTTLSIKEIAHRMGYSSQYHFSRNFKAATGTSPSDYRYRYLGNNPTGYEAKILDMAALGKVHLPPV